MNSPTLVCGCILGGDGYNCMDLSRIESKAKLYNLFNDLLTCGIEK
jgi:hypothetical protein